MNNKENPQVSFAVAIKAISDNLVAHIEAANLNAKLYRAKYLACVKEGFTEEQALALCTK